MIQPNVHIFEDIYLVHLVGTAVLPIRIVPENKPAGELVSLGKLIPGMLHRDTSQLCPTSACLYYGGP